MTCAALPNPTINAPPALVQTMPTTRQAAHPPIRPAAPSGQYDNTLTGNWFGLRTGLAAHGVSFEGYIINDTSWNLLGGISTRKAINRSRMEIGVALDTDKLIGWQGGTIVASMRFHFGPNGNDQQLGSLQGFTFVDDGPPATMLYEFYYKQELLKGGWTLRLGTMDANNIFDIPADASDFVNPSATDAPLFLQNAPPITAPGLVSRMKLTPHTALLLGAFYNDRFHPSAFDALLNTLEPVNQPVGTFLTAELDQSYHLLPRRPGVVGIGGFWRTGRFPTLNGGWQSGAGGGYFFINQTLWRTPHAGHRVAAFGNITGNDPRVSVIDVSIQAGILAAGLIPGRDDDNIGLGLDWVHISTAADTPKPYELATEAFYQYSFGHGITLQPDMQYFFNTGGGAHPDGLIAMVRLIANF